MSDFNMDAHMHFDLYKNRDEVVDYIENEKSVTIAMTNLPSLYEKYNRLYSDKKYFQLALGFHPELVLEYKRQLPLFLKYVENARFIGEVGLDFSSNSRESQNAQLDVFSSIIDKCTITSNKIMSIHSRKAVPETIECLKSFSGKIIMHWYSGSLLDQNTLVKMGAYFSINHQMLKYRSGQEIIKKIPIDRLLIESDAPFTLGMESKYSLLFAQSIYDYLSGIYNLDIKTLAFEIEKNWSRILH